MQQKIIPLRRLMPNFGKSVSVLELETSCHTQGKNTRKKRFVLRLDLQRSCADLHGWVLTASRQSGAETSHHWSTPALYHSCMGSDNDVPLFFGHVFKEHDTCSTFHVFPTQQHNMQEVRPRSTGRSDNIYAKFQFDALWWCQKACSLFLRMEFNLEKVKENGSLFGCSAIEVDQSTRVACINALVAIQPDNSTPTPVVLVYIRSYPGHNGPDTRATIGVPVPVLPENSHKE